MVGIVAFGAYIPLRRLQRSSIVDAVAWFNPGLKAQAKGERAAANWDEDAITMAVEAARDCLSGFAREAIGAVLLASTSAPFADRLNAGVVKEALNLPDTIATSDVSGSQRAGLSALIQALNTAATGEAPVLCVAAEKRRAKPGLEAELAYGDAGAALLVGNDKVVARLLATHSLSVDFVDHFRAADSEFDYGWESRWVREEGYQKLAGQAVAGALQKAKLKGGDIDAFILPVGAAAAQVAKGAGVRPEAVRDALGAQVGDAGCAQPLLMLAHALEEIGPGKKILVGAFGSGVDVVILETTAALADLPKRAGVTGALARRSPDTNYVRFLFHNGALALDRGMRGEHETKQPLTALYRNRKTVLALVGGRDPKTGAVQFPKSDLPVAAPGRNANEGPGGMEDYPFAERRARILTFTADHLTYSPDPPALYGMIEFEGGGRMHVEFCDMAESYLEVGAPVRMMFRIKAVDETRHFKRYFWKATPDA